MEVTKQLIAGRAVIEKDGKFLVIRESGQYEEGTNVGKYDFPGGRIKMGEVVQAALERETEEEAGLKVNIGQPFFIDEWRPVIKGEQVQIVGIFFLSEPLSEEVRLSADHDDYKWVSLEEFKDLPLIPATRAAFEALVALSK